MEPLRTGHVCAPLRAGTLVVLKAATRGLFLPHTSSTAASASCFCFGPTLLEMRGNPIKSCITSYPGRRLLSAASSFSSAIFLKFYRLFAFLADSLPQRRSDGLENHRQCIPHNLTPSPSPAFSNRYAKITSQPLVRLTASGGGFIQDAHAALCLHRSLS